MPDPISTGIGVAANVAQMVTGAINAAKTKKIAAELERNRPEYEISDLAQQDLDLAESEVGGLSSRAETAYNNLNNQQFASSLGAILRGGGSVNNVAELYGNNQEGRTRLALLNDQMRVQQIGNLMKTRQMMRDEQDKEWQVNDFSPWKDKQVANAAARQQAQNQLWGGIGGIANAGMNFAAGAYDQKQYDKYFAPPTSSSGSQTPGLDFANDFNFNPSNTGRMQGGANSAFTNFNPNTPVDLGELDYLTDENWLTGAHNMY